MSDQWHPTPPAPQVDPDLIGYADGYAPLIWWEVGIYAMLVLLIVGLLLYAAS